MVGTDEANGCGRIFLETIKLPEFLWTGKGENLAGLGREHVRERRASRKKPKATSGEETRGLCLVVDSHYGGNKERPAVGQGLERSRVVFHAGRVEQPAVT